MRRFFTFPNPVNEVAARSVATGVVLMSVIALVTNWSWILIPLTLGFAARVASGPLFYPLGQIATRLVAPRLEAHATFVAGPPKRFAQAVGLVVSAAASIVTVTAGWGAGRWVLLALIFAASLEAFAGFCLGCWMFAQLMKVGLVPESVCLDCADISRRLRSTP